MSSARPSDLRTYASNLSGASENVSLGKGRLESALASFALLCSWCSVDASGITSALASFIGLPGVSRTVVDCVGQAALLLLTKSCSASLGVRYPSAE